MKTMDKIKTEVECRHVYTIISGYKVGQTLRVEEISYRDINHQLLDDCEYCPACGEKLLD